MASAADDKPGDALNCCLCLRLCKRKKVRKSVEFNLFAQEFLREFSGLEEDLEIKWKTPAPAETEPEQARRLSFEDLEEPPGNFGKANGLAVSEEGEIFVADSRNHRIQVFDLEGTTVRKFPPVVLDEESDSDSDSDGSTEVTTRQNDVAMDGEGNLWAVSRTDSAEFAVQYNKQGRVLRKFNLQKTGWYRGVAVDTRRNLILVTRTTGDEDDLHGEVRVFRPDGTLVKIVGRQQGMEYPLYITVNMEGNILVSDCWNHCIYVYNEDGHFLFKFGGLGGGKGQLDCPQGICTDGSGNIVVADWGNKRVELFNKAGKFLKHVITHMWEPQAVAMATQGQLVVTDRTDSADSYTLFIFNATVLELKHDPVQCLPTAPTEGVTETDAKLARVTLSGEGGHMDQPSGVAVSDEGEIFVADCTNERIQVFALQGTFVRQFPTIVPNEESDCESDSDFSPELTMYPHDVAMDGEGNLWVVGSTDSNDFAVQYCKRGKVLSQITLQHTGYHKGIAVDTRTNHILVTKITGHRLNPHGEVQVFRPDGTLVRTVGQQQGMKYPLYLTVDGEGNILVSGWGNSCVYVYNEDGQFLFQCGGLGRGEGQLMGPRGICTDSSGTVIVADNRNSRLVLFDKTGRFLKNVATGTKEPWAVAMATQGQLVVTDCGEDKVTIFENY